MKITGNQNENNYWKNYFDECPIIKVDGVETRHVAEADDVEGYVIVECYSVDGKFLVVHDCIKTERHEGVVEIIGIRRADIAA